MVWYDVDGANSEGQERWQLKAMRIGNANARIMDEGWGTGSGATIVGHTVIFHPLTPSSAQSQPLGGDVVAVDLETGTKSTYREPAGCFQPHWNDDRYAVGTCIPVQGATNQAWGLDLANGSVFSIPLFNQTGINPPEFVYDSGKFGWTEHRADGWHVLLTPVGSALPSSSKPNPGTTNPDWLYFTETSHYLSFGFKTFWLKSGGLPVFGFPLTEEFSELNPDQGKMLTVQYMERQIFEYHAEFAGTPYEVELGRLGAEDAAERDLTGAQPFQPAAIPSTAVGTTARTLPKLSTTSVACSSRTGILTGSILATQGSPIVKAWPSLVTRSPNRSKRPIPGYWCSISSVLYSSTIRTIPNRTELSCDGSVPNNSRREVGEHTRGIFGRGSHTIEQAKTKPFTLCQRLKREPIGQLRSA